MRPQLDTPHEMSLNLNCFTDVQFFPDTVKIIDLQDARSIATPIPFY